VCECRELEEVFDTQFTDIILHSEEGGGAHSHELKKEIMKRDKELKLKGCSRKDRVPE